MKTSKKLIYFLLATLLFSSCFINLRKEIDIDIEEKDKKIVLNSLITPDSVFYVNLTLSTGVLDNDSTFKFISGAEVQVFENDELIENLHEDSAGYYRSNALADDGKNYKIIAKYQQLQHVSASTIIKSPVQIDTIVNNVILNSSYYDEYYEITYLDLSGHLIIKFNDNADEKNYYILTVEQLYPMYDWTEIEPVFIGYEKYPVYYTTESVVMSESIWSYMPGIEGSLFTDDFFNGSNFSIDVSFEYLYIEENSPLYITLHSVSDEFYNFSKSFQKYQDAIGNPLTEPVNVYSNVENGFGLFAGYSSFSDSLFFDNLLNR